jgi:hypothetical protein
VMEVVGRLDIKCIEATMIARQTVAVY